MAASVIHLLSAEAQAAAAEVFPEVLTKGKKLTDLGNGERLVSRYGRQIRYSPQRKKWLIWDGKRWAWDETGAILRLAKKVVRGIYAEAADCDDEKIRAAVAAHAKASEKAAARSAMVTCASVEEGVPVMLSELDNDPWLLNCTNGTLDLRTGHLKPHDPNDLITKTTGLPFDPGASSDLWERVRAQAVGDDAELAAYLQRVAGYALIGLALERVFFFLFGPPGTAKSTLIDAVSAALGEYAVSADFETWLLRSNIGGNRGDLVRLAGARLVTSVEGRHGARWDEALIKRATGGDMITAAAKFEHEVSFQPSFTILLAANDAPGARDDDSGLWERMRRIPLTTTIPKADRKPEIKEALKTPAHAAAVLAWAVAGCLDYQRNGLGSAKVVEQSTAEYHAENDHFGEFLADEFVFEPGERVSRKKLAERYAAWCNDSGRKLPLSSKEIAKRLRNLGCEERKLIGERMWIGLRLRCAADDPPEYEPSND